MRGGYHVYKDVWKAAVREELHCDKEQGNHQDPFTVAIASRSVAVVGHVQIEEDIICVPYVSSNRWCNQVQNDGV